MRHEFSLTVVLILAACGSDAAPNTTPDAGNASDATMVQRCATDDDHDTYIAITCCNDDGAGNPVCGSDCDDKNAAVHPMASETCDSVDNDCNGNSDEHPMCSACDPVCSGHANCVDRVCTCRQGYMGDGITCTDVDECADANACDSNATCDNQPGRFICDCNDGFVGDGSICQAWGISADTIDDPRSDLVWQRNIDSVRRDWDAAIAHCAALSLAGGGWRLPTLDELNTLVDDDYSPAIDPTVFPDTPPDWFWTSTPYATSQGTECCAQMVHFSYGENAMNGKTANNYVRCVR